MRPDTLKELLWNGFSFVSEQLLSHGPTDQTEAAACASSRDAASEGPNSPASFPLTVDRLKPPAFSSSVASIAPIDPASFYNPDFDLIWRDDPREYISPEGFEAAISLLRTWKEDIESGNVSRCHAPGLLVQHFDDGSQTESRLSAVVHNLMLERYGYNTERAWQDTVVDFIKAIEAADRWIAVFYAQENLDAIKAGGMVPYRELSALLQQSWDDTCGICALGEYLAFAIVQTEQWGHPGMQAAQIALMQLLVDLEAFHRRQPILSFVRVERLDHPPGYLCADEGGVLEAITAQTLRKIWHQDSGGRQRERQTQVLLRPLWSCHVYGSGRGALAVPSPEAARRARIVSATAAAIKSARRSTDGSGALRIPPAKSLFHPTYRRIPSGAATPGGFSLKDYSIPAKRKASTDSAGFCVAKRGRQGSDGRLPALHYRKQTTTEAVGAAKARAKAEAKSAAASAEATAATAAAIPLPPSPAATDTSLSGDESDDQADDEDGSSTAAKAARKRQQQWAAVFADESEEELDRPRLRISAAKADELRLLAEKKRAALEAARLKREAEIRRKEEERRRKEEEERLASSGLRAPRRQVIGPLSEAWYLRVRTAVRADPNRDVAKSPEGTGLKSKDFRTVVIKSEWLNDEIVNGFLLHLANYINGQAGITNPKTQTPKCHAFTSFFWKPLSTRGVAGTERWMKRVGITRDNFLQLDTILIPICESSHWTLVVVRPRRASVTHMDSLGNAGAGRRAVTDTVMHWIHDLLKDRFSDKWRVQHIGSPRQSNGWDCGVHTISNALFVSLGLDPSYYGAAEMPLQRDRIAATLLNNGFSGELDLAGL